MKAIRVNEFGPPEAMQIEDLPELIPGTRQVVLGVRAVGVNPVETYIRSGTYAIKPELPYTPGSDIAGIVESIGEGVTRVAVGDRVFASGTMTGGYAERALCEERGLYPLPELLSFSEGAGINVPYTTAYRALFHRARALPGETVLIHGASGGVGVAAVQFALGAGMTIIGTAGSKESIDFVAGLGAHHVLDHNEPAHFEQVMTLTEGNGVNVILEMLANVNLDKDLPVLARFGRVVVIGNRGTVEINPRDVMMRDAAILGMLRGNASESEMHSIYKAIGAGLSNGTLKPILCRELPLAEAPEAHRLVMASGSFGKTVLIP